jgi:predicted nucleic acid-binding protein
MILLDTNVLSETMRAAPYPAVLRWLDGQPGDALAIPAIALAELHFDVEKLDDGRRKQGYRAALRQMIEEVFQGQVVPFGVEAAIGFGSLMADRRRAGRPWGWPTARSPQLRLCIKLSLPPVTSSMFCTAGLI